MKLGPEHYDRSAGLLTFRTKYHNAQRIPVTARLAAMLDTCNGPGPFVVQLSGCKTANAGTIYDNLKQQQARLKKRLGITRKLTFHDLRRTTARRVYTITKDLREVQSALGHSDLASTAWYLQDELVTVNRATLELAKLQPPTERIQ